MADGHVQLRHVVKRFGNVVAVNDISMDVPKGCFATLLGPSGCGKTTTLRMLAGFYDVDGGEIRIGTRVVNQVPPHLRNIGMVFQDYALFPHMTIFENVSYGLKLRGVKRDRMAEKVREMLAFLGLEGFAERYPNQLSGGQQQRVALARALVTEPDVLLLDEPLSNLDAKLRVSVRRELRQIQRELGITVIYVTHDQEEALELSDLIAVMNRGVIAQIGTPWQVYFEPRSKFVADFVGAVNFLKGKVTRKLGAVAELATSVGPVVTDDPDGLGVPGQDALAAFRPECVDILNEEPQAPDGTILRGTVKSRAFLGRLVRYWVETGGTEVLVDVPDPGTRGMFEGGVWLHIRKGRIRLVAEEG